MKIIIVYLLILAMLSSLWGCDITSNKPQVSIEPSSIQNTSSSEKSIETEESRAIIRVLDVGQGDCIIITVDDVNILIDAGDFRSKKSTLEKIDSFGISQFKYVIFTHPHADHIGAAAEVVEKYTIKNIIMPNAAHTSATYENLLSAIEAKEDINVIEGVMGKGFTLGEATFTVLSPIRETYKDLNYYSVVLLMEMGEFTMLFMGDAEEINEEEILEIHELPQIDVLKVGHHGSKTSSSDAFIKSISPEYAIISLGEGNSYGHPNKETLDTFEKYEVAVYRTDENGDITITTIGNNFEITIEN